MYTLFCWKAVSAVGKKNKAEKGNSVEVLRGRVMCLTFGIRWSGKESLRR